MWRWLVLAPRRLVAVVLGPDGQARRAIRAALTDDDRYGLVAYIANVGTEIVAAETLVRTDAVAQRALVAGLVAWVAPDALVTAIARAAAITDPARIHPTGLDQSGLRNTPYRTPIRKVLLAVPAVALVRAQRGDALALEVIERRPAAEPAPTSVDDRITAALAKADRPLPLPDLRAACRVRNTTLYARLAVLTADGRVARSDDGYRLPGS